MEKPARSKGTIVLKYLQKAATFTITNNPHSPRGERLSTIRGLSGPIASIIPTEARHKKSNDEAFDEEPTSPKVTCIGQIKHKKTTTGAKQRKKNKAPSALTRMFSQRVRPDHKEAMEVKETKKKKKKKEKRQDLVTDSSVPELGQMRKFASRGESSLADFDWEKVAAAVEKADYEEGKEDLMNVYHSAPLVLGGDVVVAEHREMGLWRRRSIAALMPIEVNK